MNGEVHQGAVPLPVLTVDGRSKDGGAMVQSASERVIHVGDADPNNVRDPVRSGARRSPPRSAMITAPSPPIAIWARWLSPIRVRSRNPNAGR